MTPDMRRLCEAAVRSSGTLEIDYHAGYAPTEDPAGWEDIVRAVLTELREVSPDMLMQSRHYSEDRARSDWQDIIDYVLAEPTAPR